MKKILLIGIALLAFGYNQAQVFTIAGKDIGFVYVGPKYGMGTSFISNYTPDGVDTKLFLNVVGGVVCKFGITENISIQPELLFSRKGGKSKIEFPDFVDPNETATTTSKNIANYIGIPILAKFSFLKIKDIKLHGSGGFYTNITTGQKFKSVTKDTNGTS
ncbi:MAG: hypothetical protein C0599_13015 [Salinivirgaceae bacterium]|nr:MAG: hypothetical protein C0599_13015 [Salinivirgaceae bacterium]